MPLFRDKDFWIPLYILLAVYFVWIFKKFSWIPLLAALITILITDQLSSSVIKPLFHRIRPCSSALISSHVHLLVDCGTGYSFVSSHAANHFGIACFVVVMLKDRFRWITPVALLWALLICFAQIYVGLHYPADIVGGAIIGILAGTTTGIFCRGILANKVHSGFYQ